MSHYDISFYCSKCGAYVFSAMPLTKIERPVLCYNCKPKPSKEEPCVCHDMSDLFLNTMRFNFCPICGKALKEGFISGYEIGKGT